MRSVWIGFLWIAATLAGLAAETRVLMLGNSYTAMTKDEVGAFLKADGAEAFVLKARCPGGWTLAQHAADRASLEMIDDPEGWDVVVLQEQSQLPGLAMLGAGDTRDTFDAGAPELAKRIRKHHPQARILLFETWARHPGPDKNRALDAYDGDPARMQEALKKGYQHLARKIRGAEVVPVGQAFAKWLADPANAAVRLHRPDNSHPSQAGAHLTGAMIYRAVTGRDPAASPHRPDFKGAAELRVLARDMAAKGR